MKLTNITRQITSLQKAIEKRQKKTTDAAMQSWLQGYLQGVEKVSEFIKKEQEIERTEQRLEKLKSDQNDGAEPDWSKAPDAALNNASAAANANTETSSITEVISSQKAA